MRNLETGTIELALALVFGVLSLLGPPPAVSRRWLQALWWVGLAILVVGGVWLYWPGIDRALFRGDAMVVGVAKLGATDGDPLGLTDRVLQSLSDSLGTGGSIRVVADHVRVDPALGSEFARRRARGMGADIYVWGWYAGGSESTTVRLKFEQVDPALSGVRVELGPPSIVVSAGQAGGPRFAERVGAGLGAGALLVAGMADLRRERTERGATRIGRALRTGAFDSDKMGRAFAEVVLADALGEMGLSDSCEALYSVALRSRPEMVGAWINRSQVRWFAGDNAGAERDCEEAVHRATSRTDRAAALLNRGSLRSSLGRHREALPDVIEARQLASGWPDSWYTEALVRMYLGQLNEAADAAIQGATLERQGARAKVLASVLLVRLGRYYEAMSWAMLAESALKWSSEDVGRKTETMLVMVRPDSTSSSEMADALRAKARAALGCGSFGCAVESVWRLAAHDKLVAEDYLVRSAAEFGLGMTSMALADLDSCEARGGEEVALAQLRVLGLLQLNDRAGLCRALDLRSDASDAEIDSVLGYSWRSAAGRRLVIEVSGNQLRLAPAGGSR